MRNDYNNDEFPDSVEKWINKLLVADLVNELNRQLSKEEKEFVRNNAEEIYNNTLSFYKKSNPKKSLGDSVQKGSLIQEFGKYGEQYKIIKIDGNVLYCEEINTKKTILFKKDKEIILAAQKSKVLDKKLEVEVPASIYEELLGYL